MWKWNNIPISDYLKFRLFTVFTKKQDIWGCSHCSQNPMLYLWNESNSGAFWKEIDRANDRKAYYQNYQKKREQGQLMLYLYHYKIWTRKINSSIGHKKEELFMKTVPLSHWKAFHIQIRLISQLRVGMLNSHSFKNGSGCSQCSQNIGLGTVFRQPEKRLTMQIVGRLIIKIIKK